MNKKGNRNFSLELKDMALIGIMVAIMETAKFALSFLPNIELVTFLIILYTLFLGRKVFFAIFIFNLIEGCLYGFGIWWVSYLYIWPLLAIITYLCRRQTSVQFYSILSAVFGFAFGALFTPPFFVTGMVQGDIVSGLQAGFAYWIAGIPYDIIHGISNFILMYTLYTPIRHVLEALNQKELL